MLGKTWHDQMNRTEEKVCMRQCINVNDAKSMCQDPRQSCVIVYPFLEKWRDG